MHHLPPVVPAESASGKQATSLRRSWLSDGAPSDSQANWRSQNPGYSVAWRMDQRAAARTPEPAEPLRLPPPLNQLPWDVAKDQFGPQGADFIGVMGALIVRTTKDQIRPYLTDPTPLPGILPLFSAKDQSPPSAYSVSGARSCHLEFSPARPAMGTPASSRAAPPAPTAGLAG